jgi:hypothetical protein
MANHIGNEGVVKIAANTIAEVRSFSISQSADTTEDTVIGDTWKTHIVTQNSWTAEITCFWDEADTTGQGAMTIGASVTVNLYPEGASAGTSETYYTGTGLVTAFGTSQTHNGMIEATYSLQGTGALTKSSLA